MSERNWDLRAEEFRAIAEQMHHASARLTFHRLALGCELMAAQESTTGTPSSPSECLRRAQACEAFSRTMTSWTSQKALLRVAQRWRSMAGRIDRNAEERQ